MTAMRLLWQRKGEFYPADRRLLELLSAPTVEYVHSSTQAECLLEHEVFDVVLATGSWLREEIYPLLVATSRTGIPVVIRIGDNAITEAAALAKAGVFAVVANGSPPEELFALLSHAAREFAATRRGHSPSQQPDADWRSLLVGRSRSMELVLQLIHLVGPRRCTVLISGETGTGKEVVAKAIHRAGNRAHRPWVPVNCTALPDSLLEAELFGHTKGAFTGAVGARTGRFEEAGDGSIFLDEIGDMPLDLQAKLLRVLQEREVQKIGSSQTISIAARILAATNVNLAEKVKEGRFREDLFYRLNVVPIQIPPLRERVSDIPLLARAFIEKICRFEGIPTKRILQDTLHHLSSYHWPGNVRQLENAVEMAIVLSGERGVLLPGDFKLAQRGAESNGRGPQAQPSGPMRLPADGVDFEAVVCELERSLLLQALDRSKGNKRVAAELLRLKRTTLTAKLKTLRLAS